MKKIFSLLTILLLAGVVTAQTPDARKRVIITANNGQQTVYDVSKLRHVSFDKDLAGCKNSPPMLWPCSPTTVTAWPAQ